MNRRRILLGYLFGFIMTITLSIFILLLITKFTVFRKEYVLNIIEKDEYYLKLNDEIKEEMSLHLLSSGFTDEILENIFTYDNVVNDTKVFINDAYLGKIATIDTTEIQTNVTNNVNEFFKKSNLTYNNRDLDSFINDLVKIYSDEITLYHFTDDVITKIPKINKIINVGLIITGVLLLILATILLVIKYSYFAGTIMASGLIILFIKLVVFEKIDVSSILIITENFSCELRIILANLEYLLLIIPCILIGLGLVYLVIKSLCQTKKTREKIVEI